MAAFRFVELDCLAYNVTTMRQAPRLLMTALLLAAGLGEVIADRDAQTPSSEEIERLRALGYVEEAAEPADPTKSGAVVLNPAKVTRGYRLYIESVSCAAYLIDVEGEVVRAWNGGASCQRWAQARLLANGDFLVPGIDSRIDDEQAGRRYLKRYDWNGDEVWSLHAAVHHDVDRAEDGSLATLLLEDRSDPGFNDGARFMDNAVAQFSAEGQLLEQVSLWDLLRENSLGVELLKVNPQIQRKKRSVDLFHANSVEFMRSPKLAKLHPLYALDNVLVSLRHQDVLLMIDLRARELVWAWGQGELSGQHDARVLENGNILVFDNGLKRKRSRVVEVDPIRREIVWQYDGGDELKFFSEGRGTSQRLPNGNTLFAVSNEGEAMEVTRDGELVWRFYNPHLSEAGRRIPLRMLFYEAEPIEALLARNAQDPVKDGQQLEPVAVERSKE